MYLSLQRRSMEGYGLSSKGQRRAKGSGMAAGTPAFQEINVSIAFQYLIVGHTS